jgi:hypothetical protein
LHVHTRTYKYPSNNILVFLFPENHCQGAGCGHPQGSSLGSSGGGFGDNGDGDNGDDDYDEVDIDDEDIDDDPAHHGGGSGSGGSGGYGGFSSPDRGCPPGQQAAPHKGRCVKSSTST